jgi:hypothetical protein
MFELLSRATGAWFIAPNLRQGATKGSHVAKGLISKQPYGYASAPASSASASTTSATTSRPSCCARPATSNWCSARSITRASRPRRAMPTFSTTMLPRRWSASQNCGISYGRQSAMWANVMTEQQQITARGPVWGQGVVSSNLAAPTNKISLRARGRLGGRRSANKRPHR